VAVNIAYISILEMVTMLSILFYEQKQIIGLLKILKSLVSVMPRSSHMLESSHMLDSVQSAKPIVETFSLI